MHGMKHPSWSGVVYTIGRFLRLSACVWDAGRSVTILMDVSKSEAL